jgi:hypothetical protein
MREEAATCEEFVGANSQTSCINLMPVFAQNGGIARLLEIASFRRVTFETAEDLDAIATSHLVWYKQNPIGQAGWQYPGSQNFTVAEYSTAVQAGTADSEKAQKINELVESLKREGLSEDIILISAEDSQLNARVIVDGNSRAVALTVMLREDHGDVGKLLKSQYKMQMLKLTSMWAHVLYPCDFMDLCARQSPERRSLC